MSPFGGSAVKARSGAKATLIAYESRENRWRPFSAMNTASAAASSRHVLPLKLRYTIGEDERPVGTAKNRSAGHEVA